MPAPTSRRRLVSTAEAEINCERSFAAVFQVEAVAKLCLAHGIPHVVNNAYGVQSAALCARVSRACRVGRVDVLVQSTDKNFLVPVGGAVAALPRAPRAAEGGGSPPEYEGVVFRDMAARYPGRAAASAHVDLMITLLHLGQQGWERVLAEREEMYAYLKAQMEVAAADLGERLLHTPQNPISIAMTVDSLGERLRQRQEAQQAQPDSCDNASRAAPVRASEASHPEPPCSSNTPSSTGGRHDADGAAHITLHSVNIGPAKSGQPATGNGATCSHTADTPLDPPVPAAEESAGVGREAGEGQREEPGGAGGGRAGGRGSGVSGTTATVLGALLWQRHVSGVRVVRRGVRQTVAGVPFDGYGSSSDEYGHDYLTAAAALGETREDVDRFVAKLRKCWALV
eukprot:jgi/Ulvmu1/880/UM100_0033.1